MSVSLKSIMAPVTGGLDKFNEEFDAALNSDVKLINTIGKYLIKRRGKRIRPALTILAANLCGQPTENTYRAAAMIEMLHIATLIHDDVVDEAVLRRRWPSINRVWKNKVSILMGDYILSQSLIYMVNMKNFEILDVIAKTAEKLSSGEMLQIEKNLNKNMTEAIYFKMISRKTASLISTACQLGAITSSNKKADRSAMDIYGLNLGIAFQLKDDLFDLLGNQADTGKETSADIKRNLMTLPLINSMNHSNEIKIKISRILRHKKKTKSDITELNKIIESTNSFRYTNDKMIEFSELALAAIKNYDESQVKKSMVDLVQFNLNRKG